MANRSPSPRPPGRRSAGTRPRTQPRSAATGGGGRRLIDYPRRGKRGFRRWLPSWKLVSGVFLLGLLAGVGLFAWAYANTEIPEAAEFAEAQSTVVFYADGKSEMGRFAALNRTSVPLATLPAHVGDAVIAAEDRSFYENRGVSPLAIVRSIWGNVRGEGTQGGSTITQQYVKNYTGDDDPTFRRKIREAFVALKMDEEKTKDEILEDYLNTIYFGRGAYGIQSAAKAYYDVDAAALTPEQAATLAGIIPNPTNWDPAVDPEKAQDRFRYVVDGMVEMGTLTTADPAALVMPETIVQVKRDTYGGPNGYILATVRSELLERSEFTEQQIDTGGLRITTTISKTAQTAALAAMADEDAFPSEDRPETLHAALTAIDPATGGIVAMYGGPDFLTRQSNGATQDQAQAGSTFKPFTLVAALEEGISLKSRYNGRNNQTFDAYVDEAGDERPVKNFGGSSFGDIDLERATENSVNTVYVALNEEVGPDKTREVAVRAGLPEDTPGLNDFLSNVLGTASPHPIDMAAAYSTFAARGERHTPHIVASVTAPDQTEPSYLGPTEGSRVFEEDVMDDTNFALQQVIESGSGEYASRLDRPAAGKTGTSSDNRSAWFVGFTPQLAASVALYNVEEDGSPSPIPAFGGRREITGGSFPVRIWTAFMQGALEGAEVVEFAPRADVGKANTPTQTPTRSTPSPTTTTPTPTETTPTETEPPATTEPPLPDPTVTLPIPTEPPPEPPPGDGGGGGGAPPGAGAPPGGGPGGGGAAPGG